MTYQDLAKIAHILNVVEEMTMEQGRNPEFIGTLRAQAFIVGRPIRRELENEVEIVQEVA